MLPMRRSETTKPNEFLGEDRPRASVSNTDWLGAISATRGLGVAGDLVLLGGAALSDFRVRVAQSHVRRDLTPSTWSLTGIATGSGTILSVPLGPIVDPSAVAASNAIQERSLDEFADPKLFPNIAVVRFPANPQLVIDGAGRLRSQRSVVDLPSHLLDWLGFTWGAGTSANPLLQGVGVPSAVFVETVFAMASVELTPGLASAASCPEAIWQAAKWWHPFYESAPATTDQPDAQRVPSGRYVVRQPRATYVDPD
jgi:hypothetical protein